MRSGGGTLREVTGDLFSQETEGLALCHCVSRCLAMGKGIAVLFKRKFGGVEELRGQQLEVGDCGRLLRRVGVSGGALVRPIYYLITKPRYFHKPTLDDLRSSLEAMRDDFCTLLAEETATTGQGGGATPQRPRHIAMPRIGCGLDGLSWDGNVRDLCLDVFDGTGICITVYSLGK